MLRTSSDTHAGCRPASPSRGFVCVQSTPQSTPPTRNARASCRGRGSRSPAAGELRRATRPPILRRRASACRGRSSRSRRAGSLRRRSFRCRARPHRGASRARSGPLHTGSRWGTRRPRRGRARSDPRSCHNANRSDTPRPHTGARSAATLRGSRRARPRGTGAPHIPARRSDLCARCRWLPWRRRRTGSWGRSGPPRSAVASGRARPRTGRRTPRRGRPGPRGSAHRRRGPGIRGGHRPGPRDT